MKTREIFRKTFFASALLASTLFMASCDKEDDDTDNDQTYTVSGNASGSQENPAVVTSATATLNGTYNARTNVLSYSINWTGLSGVATVAHFHGPAMAGVNANPLHDITLSVNGISGSATGSVTLADSTETHLLNGRVYYNIHTAAHPTGEIRSQVTAIAN